MVTVSSPELLQFAAALAGDGFRAEEAKALAEAYEEYAAPLRRALAPVAWWVDGRDFRSFYEALAHPRVDGRSGEIRLGGPVGGGPGWEFLVPFRRLLLLEDGSAELYPAEGGASRHAIVRFLLRDRIALDAKPASAAPGGQVPTSVDSCGSLAEEVRLCRASRLLPFGVAVLVYLPSERVRFELDLVHNYLLGDPRAGRLAPGRRVARTARFSWGLDRQIARGRLSPLASRCLELLAETHGLTAMELAQILSAPRELVGAAMKGVVDRGFATADRRTARYHAQLEAFLPQAAAVEEPTPADPALRTSVQELLAAADAKATCPLCGAALGSREKLLCDDCSRAVGLSP